MKSLQNKSLKVTILVAATAIACGAATAAPAKPKPTIVESRQEQLMKDINYYQKLKELTDKQANKLRKALANVARKKAKSKRKNNKVVDDETKSDVMEDLDEISSNIKKYREETRAGKESKSKESK